MECIYDEFIKRLNELKKDKPSKKLNTFIDKIITDTSKMQDGTEVAKQEAQTPVEQGSDTINHDDIRALLKEYSGEWSMVIGDNKVGYVSEEGVPYTRNRSKKITSIDGELWIHLLGNKRKFNALKKYYDKVDKLAQNKITKKEQEAVDELMAMSKEQIEEAKRYADTAVENSILGSGDIYDVEISDKALEQLTKFNEQYMKDNEVKIVESNMFRYDIDTEVVEVDKDATNEEKQVFLKHELLHHMTYNYIVNELDTETKEKLLDEVENINSIPDALFSDEDMNLVATRLRYALNEADTDRKVAEVVAILGAEPKVRKALEDMSDVSTLKQIIDKFVEYVKSYIGKEKELANSAKYVLDGVDQIIKDSDKKTKTTVKAYRKEQDSSIDKVIEGLC